MNIELLWPAMAFSFFAGVVPGLVVANNWARKVREYQLLLEIQETATDITRRQVVDISVERSRVMEENQILRNKMKEGVK